VECAYFYDFQLVSGALETARANLAALAHQRAVIENLRQFLVGKMPENLPLGLPFDDQGLDIGLPPSLSAEELLMRPDVMSSEQRLMAVHANIGTARADFLPKVLLSAGLGLAGPGLAGLYRAGAWVSQPVITMPLFDDGRAASAVDEAGARKIIAVVEYERTKQMAFGEVANPFSTPPASAATWKRSTNPSRRSHR
jgi:multidrug efflux system outer membrane protein